MTALSDFIRARGSRQTPWGEADHATLIGATYETTPPTPTLFSVSTSSHGGIWIPQEYRRHIPPAVRALTHDALGESGWYEEDCDWQIAALAFPRSFLRLGMNGAADVAYAVLENHPDNGRDPDAEAIRMFGPDPKNAAWRERVATRLRTLQAWDAPAYQIMTLDQARAIVAARDIVRSL